MKKISFLASLTLIVGVLPASSAQASTVTVGSPLTASFAPQTFSGVGTVFNSALPESGAHVASPVTGTLVRWRVAGASGGPFRLRVLRPASGTSYTGAGTSSPASPTGTSIQTFTTSLPIHAGDLIGIDNTNNSDQLGNASVTGAAWRYFVPPLADGSTRTSSAGTTTNIELGFNADVLPLPSNTSITSAHIKRRKGKATFSFTGADASGFQCELKKPRKKHHKKPKAAFSPCSSPRTYKHLKPGKYTFEVQGINSGGADPRPAITKFKI